ncbi:hypothetical protein GCM10020229_54750 [Kitasatospora albolonga]
MNTARLDRLTPDQRAELERRLAGRRTAPPRERQEAPVDLTASHPLSDTQYRLWLAEQAHGPSAAFTVPVALRVEGALDTGRLQACLDLLAERHLACAPGSSRRAVLPGSASTCPRASRWSGGTSPTARPGSPRPSGRRPRGSSRWRGRRTCARCC